MNINTTRFGMIAIQAERIIQMPYGMIGFPDHKRFVIMPHKENSPFYWYQSLDDPELAYVITNPFFFIPDYVVDLDDRVHVLPWDKADGKHELALYVIVNIPKGEPQKMTANLIGPLVVNSRTRQSVQIVVPDSAYSHRFPLLEPAGAV